MINTLKTSIKFTALPLVVAMASVPAHAQVVVTDINFSGLQRLTPESLYPMLPVTVGSTVTEESLAASVRAMYDTGLFADVQSDVTDDKLVFKVVERPVIAEVNFDGNKLIPTEGLQQGLEAAGLAVGDVLKQSTLIGVANELQQQYIMQGYYNSDIKVDQTLLDGNRVKLDVNFDEGKAAEVVKINVNGNNHFSDGDIKRAMLLKESSWATLLNKSDRYAKDKLAASIKRLEQLYFNDGFVRFEVLNSNVEMSDDKQSVTIDLAVQEGQQYRFNNVGFVGNTNYGNDTLSNLVTFKSNEQFSQEQLDDTTRAIKNHMGNDGYYFAQIRPVTKISDANKTVDVDFYIDPVRAVYVRRINFSGNTKTKDEVLRREMRQLEGAAASNEKLELSRIRLMRTGFFKSVKFEAVPVAGLPDQIDINFTVEEQSTGSSTLAAGYSQSGGLTFQADLSQNNFLGTGNRFNLGFSRSESRENYSIGLADPYFTKDGVSQSVNAYYRKTKYDDTNISNYVTDSYGGSLKYGYPVNENIRISGGVNIDNTQVRAGRFIGIANANDLIKDGGEVKEFKGSDGSDYYTFDNDYATYNLLLGWNYSSLDRPVFPTEGMSHNIDLTVGFGDKTYQKAVYNGNVYFPVYKDDLILRGYTKLGYGNDLPFYQNFFSGGSGSVRGYDYSSLGPKSPTFYNSAKSENYYLTEVGGNAMATFGTELILPIPFKGEWTEKVRPVLFVEGGQVFDTTGKEDENLVYNGTNTNVPLIFQDNDLRYSAGAGVTWNTPIGPISLSYAKPFGDKKGDDTEQVQFQIGNLF